MTALEVIRDVLARLVWIREEAELLARERALEDLEQDVVGWLAVYEE